MYYNSRYYTIPSPRETNNITPSTALWTQSATCTTLDTQDYVSNSTHDANRTGALHPVCLFLYDLFSL
eukprot:8514383-Pyramimonas_sp.AAC.1